jgi:hypothetical protein
MAGPLKKSCWKTNQDGAILAYSASCAYIVGQTWGLCTGRKGYTGVIALTAPQMQREKMEEDVHTIGGNEG